MARVLRRLFSVAQFRTGKSPNETRIDSNIPM